MVRHQGIDRITWTYDPLLSRNAHLNIARLGAVCNSYIRDAYGEMRDELNQGVPSDRFQVDWWVNSKRVLRRMSKRPRPPLDLAHYLAAGIPIINPTRIGSDDLPRPAEGRARSPASLGIRCCWWRSRRISWRSRPPTGSWPSPGACTPVASSKQLFQSGYLITDFGLPARHKSLAAST